MFSINIKNIRTKQNMSQEELAKKARINQGYLSQIENGKKWPSRITLEKIAEALNCGLEIKLVKKKTKALHI